MKKIAKIAGNLLMIAALVFLIKKIMGMDADFTQFGSPNVIAALVLSFTVQTAVIVMGTFPWLMFTQALSGTKIPFSAAMPVYTKSNVFKYVPGNVFQYIGRNYYFLPYRHKILQECQKLESTYLSNHLK